jgi:hypothetical protein
MLYPIVHRSFVMFLLCVCVSFVSRAQTAPKRILGTFLFEKKAYNYEFTEESFDSYSLNITAANGQSPAKKAVPDSDATSTNAVGAGQPVDSAAAVPDNADEGGTETSTMSGIPFNEFSQREFQAIFIELMKTKYDRDSAGVAQTALEVFFKIKARLDFIDDDPITAYFILRRDSINSFLQYNASKFYDRDLSDPIVRHYIHRVEAETEDGALKNITVYAVRPKDVRDSVATPRQFIVFKNQFPISMSGKFDYEKFTKINLYCYNCAGIDGLSRFVRLMDLAIFDIVYANDKEDYSPRNLTFSVTPAKPIMELRKERRSRILELAAFSDLVGLDRAEPNGLLQIEARRRININTKYRLLVRGESRKLIEYNLSTTWFRKIKQDGQDKYEVYQFPSWREKRLMEWIGDRYSGEQVDLILKDRALPAGRRLNKGDSLMLKSVTLPSPEIITIPHKKFRSPYFNFFGYLEPRLLFSKLEENNRFVDSAKAGNGTLDAIDVYRYQVASFGVHMQVFRMSFPQIKLQWNVINTGLTWSRTRVALTADSAGPTTPLNSSIWQFGTNIIFRPDSRWGASLGIEFLLPNVWNDDYQLSSKKGLFQDQFDAWLRTGDEGKLFFRFRWTYQNAKRNNNFTQVQLGYSLNLFAGKNPEPPKQ